MYVVLIDTRLRQASEVRIDKQIESKIDKRIDKQIDTQSTPEQRQNDEQTLRMVPAHLNIVYNLSREYDSNYIHDTTR